MMDPCVDLEDELYFLRDEVDRLQTEIEMRQGREAILAKECERLTRGLWDKGEFVDQLNGVIRRQRKEIERLRLIAESYDRLRVKLGLDPLDDVGE